MLAGRAKDDQFKKLSMGHVTRYSRPCERTLRSDWRLGRRLEWSRHGGGAASDRGKTGTRWPGGPLGSSHPRRRWGRYPAHSPRSCGPAWAKRATSPLGGIGLQERSGHCRPANGRRCAVPLHRPEGRDRLTRPATAVGLAHSTYPMAGSVGQRPVPVLAGRVDGLHRASADPSVQTFNGCPA
jgi:hypothetical protein